MNIDYWLSVAFISKLYFFFFFKSHGVKVTECFSFPPLPPNPCFQAFGNWGLLPMDRGSVSCAVH